VSYSSTFNWAHRIRGHLFQGRFRSLLIEERKSLVEVARYLHLNPVRLRGLALGKDEQRRARVADIEEPGAERIRERLRILDDYAWSSWRVYAGSEPRPPWLTTGTILGGCGGRTVSERRLALREYTEAPIRQGRLDSPWERVVGGLVLGSKEFASQVLKPSGANAAEDETKVAHARVLRPEWEAVVAAAEQIGRQEWSKAIGVHGNWLRDAVLHTRWGTWAIGSPRCTGRSRG
jgi:hypothetical protein